MAKNKKSFVAYADWIDTFEELEDDEAGRLAKHLFRYVNDLNPTPQDKLVKMCFIPIKNALKRDLVKYESIRERNRLNGLKGGRPVKAKEPSGLSGNPEKPQKADSDNVSVSVNVSDTVNEEPKLNTWRDSFGIYLKELSEKHLELIKDDEFISLQEKYNPNVDIVLSIEKAINNFWGTEAGWKNKKSKRTKVINWKSTLTKAIDMNKVYKQNEKIKSSNSGGFESDTSKATIEHINNNFK